MNLESQEHQEKPQDILAIKQKVFNFFLDSEKDQYYQKNCRIKYRNSFHNSFGAIQQENAWRPKLPCKRIYDDPKFLLSLERKKIRIINGLRSEFETSSTFTNQFKSHRKKSRKQSTSYRQRGISQAQKFTQNYIHTSLNFNLNQNHRVVKTPYLNFNLHHLIKQKKIASMQLDHENINSRKKGSNIPYYASVLSHKFDKSHKNNEGQELQKLGQRNKVKTAKTIQGKRQKIMTMGRKRYQQQNKEQIFKF